MAENENRKQETTEEEIPQSAAARIMRGLGEDQKQQPEIEVEPVGFWENFWYHHKWKTIIISFVAVVAIICGVQMSRQDNPDIYVMYAGPAFVTTNEARSVQDAMKQIMEDYNGDGKKVLLLADFNYYTPEQIEEERQKALADGVELTVDNYGNSQAYEQFEMEVIAGESVIYILDPALYENVKRAGGLLPLSEFGDAASAAAIDEYGIRLSETKFAQYFSAMDVFPEDAVLCIRRISTMAVFKGQKKTERLHSYHTALFEAILAFDFPEGYTDTPAGEETSAAG